MTKTKNIELTEEQTKALDQILAFWKHSKSGSLLTMGGYAGTGKTTLIAEAVRTYTERQKKKERPAIAFCAFTGRAASVLRGKLERHDILGPDDYCGTIHGLIYQPKIEKGVVVGWRRVDGIMQELIVVDEASMVNEEIFRDLQSYGCPILAVGDHGQLPPINSRFNLMERPAIRLETIHRQAADNPIVKLSMMARQGERIAIGSYGPGVSKTANRRILDQAADIGGVMILCGTNQTRVRMNAYVRARLGIHSAEPIVGDRLICLKNNRDIGIYNGMTGILKKIADKPDYWYDVHILMDNGNCGDLVEVLALKEQFGQRYTIREHEELEQKQMGELFDWGYAMTVHKAQGGEAKRVALFEERMPRMTDDEWRRWLYTGITRSSERLVIIGD